MISAIQENDNNNNKGTVSPVPMGPVSHPYRDTSHSPEITDDVFSPESGMQTQESKVGYSYSEETRPPSTGDKGEYYYPRGSFSTNQVDRNGTGEEAADPLSPQAWPPGDQCQDFDRILKKVEQRNSQSESVFSDGAPAGFGAQNLEQQSLSSFTQLMSESFNTSFDLTSIAEPPGPLYPDTPNPKGSPPVSSGGFYRPTETDTGTDKPTPLQSPYYPAAVDSACMYYPGYWNPYASKEYLNRLYYAQRYSPYSKSSSTSTHPYAFSKPTTPSGSTSSFSGYATTPTLYPASLNGSTSSFDGAGMSLGTGQKLYGSSGSLSPAESPAPSGFLGKRKSGRRKKPARPVSSGTEPHVTRVFVWDLDETSIILISLLNGMFAGKFNHESSSLQEIGLSMNEIIYTLINTHFFNRELEECDQVHFEDVSVEDNGIELSSYDFSTDGFTFADIQPQALPHKSATSATSGATCATQSAPGAGRNTQDWCKKLAYRYRRVQEIYSKYGCDLETLLGQEQYTAWYKLLCKLEGITDQWVSQARKCLMLIQSTPGYANILVSSCPLILTLGKCLLFGLSQVFHVGNVYSSHNTGKSAVFERLAGRFGTKCTYVSIGDSPEDEDASKKHNFPFWRVSSQGDLVALERALQLQHL